MTSCEYICLLRTECSFCLWIQVSGEARGVQKETEYSGLQRPGWEL